MVRTLEFRVRTLEEELRNKNFVVRTSGAESNLENGNDRGKFEMSKLKCSF